MDRSDILHLIRAQEPALRALGVGSACLFGSAARNALNADSDVDVLIDGAPPRRLSLFDLVRVQTLLETALQRKVDVVAREGLTRAPELQRSIEADLIDVF
jgi:predicted nucleotidyltransferase